MEKTFHLTKTDHKTRDFRIEQGALFERLTCKYPGDFSGFIPSGQVRTHYADNPKSELLGNFSFPDLVYDAETDRTIIIPRMIPSETLKCYAHPTIRKNINDPVLVGQNVWVYDLKLSSQTDEDLIYIILKGYVEISQEVTRID